MSVRPAPAVRDALERLRFQRYLTSHDLPKPPKGHCRWCHGPNPTRRHTWCSPECRTEGGIRFGMLRHLIDERDHGVCANCGADTEKIQRVLDRAASSLCPSKVDRFGFACTWDAHREAKRLRALLGAPTETRLYEIDHIVPVVEGGGCCGLDNLQTLCWKCHRIDTAVLARRRADRKRGQVSLLEEAG